VVEQLHERGWSAAAWWRSLFTIGDTSHLRWKS